MRQISISVLLLGLACDVASAQKPDSLTFFRAPVVATRSRAAARRDAEQRRRRIDFLDARSLSPTAAFLGKPQPLWATTLLTAGAEQTVYLLGRSPVSRRPGVPAARGDLARTPPGAGRVREGDRP